MPEYELRVSEARQRDVGRGIVRVDLKTLGIEAGDYVKIKGNRTTYAKAFPAHHDDEKQNLIRTDGYVRKNAVRALGEIAYVSKFEPQPAGIVVVTKTGESVNVVVDEEFLDFLERSWSKNYVVTLDDLIPARIFGHMLDFRVLDYTPNSEAVEINENSQIVIAEPRKPRQPRPMHEYVGEMLKTMYSDGYRFRIPTEVLAEDLGEMVERRLGKNPTE